MIRFRFNHTISLSLTILMVSSSMIVYSAQSQSLRYPASNKQEDPIFTSPEGSGGAQFFVGIGGLAVGIAGLVSLSDDFIKLKSFKEKYDSNLKNVLDYRTNLVHTEGLLTVEDRFRNLQYLNAELDAVRRNAVSGANLEMVTNSAAIHSPEVVSRINTIETELSRQSVLQAALTDEQAELRRASQSVSESLKRELNLLRSGDIAMMRAAGSSVIIDQIQILQGDVYKSQVLSIEEQIKKWNDTSVISQEEKAARIALAKVNLVNAIKTKRVSFGRYARRLGIRAFEITMVGVAILDLGGRIYVYNVLEADPTLSPTFTYLKAKLTQ